MASGIAVANLQRSMNHAARSALSSALLACAALTLGACGAAPESDSEDTDTLVDALSEEGHLQVVQYNPFYGGQYPKYAYAEEGWQSLPKSYETMEAFAASLQTKYPNAAVIGMQEIVSESNAQQIQQRLVAATGKPWLHVHFGNATHPDALAHSTEEAIFWREDLVSFIQDFGTREVQRYKKGDGSLVSVRFGGALFQKKNTDRWFGFFTGKLTPRNQTGADGQPLDDGDKVEEVERLSAWMTKKLANHPYATRIVTMDMNAEFGSAPWKRMSSSMSDAKDSTTTWKSPHTGEWRRYDYVFWDVDAGGKRKGGFFDDPHVMGKTGSDHKAVIADVYVRASFEAQTGHVCDVRCCDSSLFRVHANDADQCHDQWTVCRGHGYTRKIRFNGDLIFSKKAEACQ